MIAGETGARQGANGLPAFDGCRQPRIAGGGCSVVMELFARTVQFTASFVDLAPQGPAFIR